LQSESSVLAAEYFAAKDCAFLSVPCGCGLRAADTLVVDGYKVTALSDRCALPLSFPDLNENVKAGLSAMALAGQKLAVGELTVMGAADAYFLRVEVVS
jgi:hypothetical protein